MKSAFDKIAAGLDDAIAYAGGDETRGRKAMAVDVKAIRAATKKTQAGFAQTYHLPIGSVRDWEQGRSMPDSGSATLLKMIAVDPQAVEQIIAKVPGQLTT